MKKLLLFVAVVSAFTFASCKKSRSCTCTGTYNTTRTDVVDWQTSPTSTATTTSSDAGSYTTIYTDAKKGDAKKACVNTSTEDVTVDTLTGYAYYSGSYQTFTTVRTETSTNTGTCDLK